MLNPNCSEAVMRVRVNNLSKDKRAKIIADLEALKNSEDEDACMSEDTSIDEQTMFGVECIVIDGDGPFNSRGAIDEVLDKHNIPASDIEVDEQ